MEQDAAIIAGKPLDFTSPHNLLIQWFVLRLSKRDRPFKLYQLGAGVKRITTETTTCPCCKRPLC